MRLIDADEFDKELLSGWISQALGVSHRRKYTIGEIRGMIQKRQTVDAVPVVHGLWIDMGNFEQCSVCKATHLKGFNSLYGKVTWIRIAYCPNCGAKMDEKIDL